MMMKKKMTTGKRDAIFIALLSAVSLASIIANIVLHVPFSIMSLPLIGIVAYCAYIRLGDYDIQIICDYIQTGEAAVGSFALFAVLVFISGNPYIALLLVFLALLVYELFLRAAIAPDKKELAINGAAAQAILIVIVGFILAGGATLRINDPRTILFGYFPSLGISFVAPTAALLLAALLFFLTWAFKPELRLFSHGPAFFKSGSPVRTGVSAAVIIARSILLTITIFFAGWICGIGISIHRLYRGRQADAITLLSLICFWQIITLLAKLAGPRYAAALMYAASYALFIPYFNKRVFLYDRYQQS
jgi:hypothetical protein